MAETGSWNGRVFEVTGPQVMSFKALTIDAGSETKTKKSGSEQYESYKAAKPATVKLTVTLHAGLGVAVRLEAMQWIEDAGKGKTDYFYVGGAKLTPCQLMLTEAQVSETQIAPGGMWVAAQVNLTLTQASKWDGSGGAAKSSGSKKATVKSGSGAKGKENIFSKAVRLGKERLDQYGTPVKATQSEIERLVAEAKAAKLKKLSTSSEGGGIGIQPAMAVE